MTKKRLIYSAIFLFVTMSCSSLPERNYSKNNLKNIYTNYLQVADKARQQENYSLALNYYKSAIDHANARNERYDVGIIHLKIALIYLYTEDFKNFENETSIVKRMNNYESLGLDNKIDFVFAKHAYMTNNHTLGNKLLTKLLNIYSNKDDSEKTIYYKFQYQKYNPNTYTSVYQKTMINMLQEWYNDGELENIEILSFCWFQYCTSLMNEKSPQFEKEIQKALKFYRMTENPRRIKTSYKLMADYFKMSSPEKSDHFLKLSK